MLAIEQRVSQGWFDGRFVTSPGFPKDPIQLRLIDVQMSTLVARKEEEGEEGLRGSRVGRVRMFLGGV